MDYRQYQRAIRKMAADLDPESARLDQLEDDPEQRIHLRVLSEKEIFLTSIRNPEKDSFPGQVLTAKPWTAAERIHAGTHRVSTPEEIAQWKKHQSETSDAIRAVERSRKMNDTGVDPSVVALLSKIKPDTLKTIIAAMDKQDK
jgi:hypothetical protein